MRAAVAGDVDRHSAWVGDLYKIGSDQFIASLAKLRAKDEEWIGYYNKGVACPLEPLYRDANREAEEIDSTICSLQEVWKKAPMQFDEAVMALDAELAKHKDKLEQAEFDKRKKEYDLNLKRCAQSTNKLLGILRRVEGCKKGACNAKMLGTIDDDRQRAQDELDGAVNQLNAILSEQVARKLLSPEKEAEIRRQGKRAGCLQLVP